MHYVNKLFVRVFFAILFIPTIALGQNREVKGKEEQLVEFNIAPLSILSLRPRYRIGLEYQHQKWSYSFNGEYGSFDLNHFAFRGGRWGEAYRYYALRPQISYRFNDIDQIEQCIGVEAFYINNSDRFKGGYFQQSETSGRYYFYEEADYKRALMGIHFVFETKGNLCDWLSLEAYIGLGAGYRKNEYSNIDGLRITDAYIHQNGILFQKYRKEGSGWVASGTIGLNFSFILWRNI